MPAPHFDIPARAREVAAELAEENPSLRRLSGRIDHALASADTSRADVGTLA